MKQLSHTHPHSLEIVNSLEVFSSRFRVRSEVMSEEQDRNSSWLRMSSHWSSKHSYSWIKQQHLPCFTGRISHSNKHPYDYLFSTIGSLFDPFLEKAQKDPLFSYLLISSFSSSQDSFLWGLSKLFFLMFANLMSCYMEAFAPIDLPKQEWITILSW